MLRVVVLGSDIEGLLVSWTMRQHPGLDVWMIGKPPLGGNGDSETLPTVVHTWSMRNLLDELGIAYASFKPRNGILLRGQIRPYPACLLSLSDAESVWNHVRAKALLQPVRMNGQLKRRPTDRRLRCAYEELVEALAEGVQFRAAPSWRLEPGRVTWAGGSMDYDFAVLTGRLSECAGRTWFRLPSVESAPLTTISVVPRMPAIYRRWDRVLTPYTPDGAIHEINANGHAYNAESVGEHPQARMLSDLNFLFRDGYEIREVTTDEAVIPYRDRTHQWPEHVQPLGSKAFWRPDITLDEVLDGAYELMRIWTR